MHILNIVVLVLSSYFYMFCIFYQSVVSYIIQYFCYVKKKL